MEQALHARVRRLNDAIVELARATGPAAGPVAFVCECRRPGCFSTVWLDLGAYESIDPGVEARLVCAGHPVGIAGRPLAGGAAQRRMAGPDELAVVA